MAEHFYVTVVNGRRVGYLLGPYDQHATALANVERGRALAERADAYSHFYAFGTAKVTGSAPIKTVFGAEGL